MVSNCLIPGPEVIQDRGNTGMAFESLFKEAIGVMGFVLLTKANSQANCLAISRN